MPVRHRCPLPVTDRRCPILCPFWRSFRRGSYPWLPNRAPMPYCSCQIGSGARVAEGGRDGGRLSGRLWRFSPCALLRGANRRPITVVCTNEALLFHQRALSMPARPRSPNAVSALAEAIDLSVGASGVPSLTQVGSTSVSIALGASMCKLGKTSGRRFQSTFCYGLVRLMRPARDTTRSAT
jgi:hypothetical protein